MGTTAETYEYKDAQAAYWRMVSDPRVTVEELTQYGEYLAAAQRAAVAAEWFNS